MAQRLLLCLLLVASLPIGRSKKKYCGESLEQALELLCNGKYAAPQATQERVTKIPHCEVPDIGCYGTEAFDYSVCNMEEVECRFSPVTMATSALTREVYSSPKDDGNGDSISSTEQTIKYNIHPCCAVGCEVSELSQYCAAS